LEFKILFDLWREFTASKSCGQTYLSTPAATPVPGAQVPCQSRRAQRPPQCSPIEWFLQGWLGRLEQEHRGGCRAQTEEEREGEGAAAGNVMLRVMRGPGGCSSSD